ncbi:cystatin-A-like [Paramacrobiotus metropolitanus]|uniref:cystatin-A-like n=1 Tax=Paramacrobiotus metropolitanus TaxID=2943436 RepID=UPI0024458FD4|nr:cystatin-A-like [Paramacrobiotus metropolitanus]
MTSTAYIVLAALLVGAVTSQTLGGLSAVKKANGEVKGIIQSLSPQILARAKLSANIQLVPTEYSSQVVAGTVYYIKVSVGPVQPGGKYLFVKVNQDLKGKNTLAKVKQANANEPLAYF